MGGLSRWYGQELENLRIDYAGEAPMREIALKYGTSLGAITRLSKIHGWPARRPSGLIRNRLASAILRQQQRAEKVQAIIDAYQSELGGLEQAILYLQERVDA